jgi:hypothetical protein
MWRVVLLVILIESQDIYAMHPHAALKILWRYFVITDRDSTPFNSENCLKEKLTDSVSGSLALSLSYFR